jgi:hypothetical protein
LKVIREFDDLSYIFFAIGIEVFTQRGYDLMDKGVKWENVRQVLKEAVDRGAVCRGLLMDNIPFLDNEMVKESYDNIEWLSRNVKRTVGIEDPGLMFTNGTPVEWPTEEIARRYGDYEIIKIDHCVDTSRLWQHDQKIISKLPIDVQFRNFQIRRNLAKYYYVAGYSDKI